MAQFKISLPVSYRDELNDQLVGISREQQSGALPAYPVFVNNLMKTMATPAEELHHACTGMSGEAGETLDISKKVWVYGKELDVAHLLEELGDMRFYYQATLNMLGLTDDHIRAINMIKLRKRYAEGKYSDAAAIARADKALSAEGSKGDGKPTQRNFMGMGKVSEEQAAAAARGEKNIHDAFDAEVNRSLRTLRRDEQP